MFKFYLLYIFLSNDEIAYLFLNGGSGCEVADNEFLAAVISKIFGPSKDVIVAANKRLRTKETELQSE